MPNPRPGFVEILLVEDNLDDADHMREALQESDLKTNIHVVEDGEEAIQYLRRLGRFGDATRPDLILLDLHLPRKNGQEVLAEIKEDESLRRIPVIVMTSLGDERIFQGAYDLHANCCVRKPVDWDQFTQTVKKIEHFWLRVASTIRGQ